MPNQSVYSYNEVVTALQRAMSAFDNYLLTHSANVTRYVNYLCAEVDTPQPERAIVLLAANFHDIGKLTIPRGLLRKPSRLTAEEYTLVKSHPIHSEHILLALEKFSSAAHLVRHHHERWDGAGYPDGLSGTDIPRGARMIAIVDAYAAMTNHRPYAPHVPPQAAHDEIVRCAGTQFDPELVAAFSVASQRGNLWTE